MLRFNRADLMHKMYQQKAARAMRNIEWSQMPIAHRHDTSNRNPAKAPTSLVKAIVIVILLLGLFAAMQQTFAQPSDIDSGAEHNGQSDGIMSIEVPGGNVDALYEAVYENDLPRDNVEITLGAGVFQLDPSKGPFEGRLVLGKNTTLRSTFEMVVDVNGVPTVDADNNPIESVPGARIDGGQLSPEPFGEGIIMVGNDGLVENLWLDSGARPGVVITVQGTIRNVASTAHSVGFQARATGQEVNGVLEGNLAANNSLLGIAIIAVDPLLSQPTESKIVRANVSYNASVNNGHINFGVFGGVGSTTNGDIHVTASHNVFRVGATLGNIRIVGGTNVSAAGSHNNEVTVDLEDNLVADTTIGLKVEGGALTPFGPEELEQRQSSNNKVMVNISTMTFDNSALDIRVEGAQSRTDEPAGDNNEATVVILGADVSAFTVEIIDCFPEANWTTNSKDCTNEAKITSND